MALDVQRLESIISLIEELRNENRHLRSQIEKMKQIRKPLPQKYANKTKKDPKNESSLPLF